MDNKTDYLHLNQGYLCPIFFPMLTNRNRHIRESFLSSIEHKDLYNQTVKHDYCNFRDISFVKCSIRTCKEKSQQISILNDLRFMNISQPGMKSNIEYCHNG